MSPSPSHVILEGIRLATEADIGGFQDLTSAFPEVLKLELILRILLSFLPESVNPSLYTAFLRDLVSRSLLETRNNEQRVLDTEASEEEANHQLRSLQLRTLQDSSLNLDSSLDPLSLFLISRARQIDSETGNIFLVKELIEPFLDHSRDLRIWAISTLLPLLRINYELLASHDFSYTLEDFEDLQGGKALNSLLSASDSQIHDTRDETQLGKGLRSLVGPWILGEPLRKRWKMKPRIDGSREELEQPLGLESGLRDSSWSTVNEWLQETSMTNLPRATQAIEEWDGPQDVDYGGWATKELEAESSTPSSTTAYLETILSVIYSSPYTSTDCYVHFNQILARLTFLTKTDIPLAPASPDRPPSAALLESKFLCLLNPADLEPQNLRTGSNPLTTPSTAAINLARALVWSSNKLAILGYPLEMSRVAQLCLFDSPENQQKEFQKLVRQLRTHGVKDDLRWTQIRQDLLQLRSLTSAPSTTQNPQASLLGVFSRVSIDTLETELLQAYLSNSSRSCKVFLESNH